LKSVANWHRHTVRVGQEDNETLADRIGSTGRKSQQRISRLEQKTGQVARFFFKKELRPQPASPFQPAKSPAESFDRGNKGGNKGVRNQLRIGS
jgi:hypothetical protein